MTRFLSFYCFWKTKEQWLKFSFFLKLSAIILNRARESSLIILGHFPLLDRVSFPLYIHIYIHAGLLKKNEPISSHNILIKKINRKLQPNHKYSTLNQLLLPVLQVSNVTTTCSIGNINAIRKFLPDTYQPIMIHWVDHCCYSIFKVIEISG